MADDIVSNTIISVGGYDSSQNHLNLDTNFPGMASDLLNYEVGLNGGYRKINGFEYYNSDFPEVTNAAFAPAEGKILGVAIFNSDGGDIIMAARKRVAPSLDYTWYQYVPGGTPAWVATSGGGRYTSGGFTVNSVSHVQANFGGKQYIIFADGVNKPSSWDGTTWSVLDGDQMIPRPGTVEIFKNHVFFGRSSEFPGLVGHSAPNDPLEYDVAAGAGQIIAGFKVNQIKQFRDSLYVFGQTHIKNISVSGTDFVLNDVTSNIGNLARNSVQEIAGDLVFLGPDGIRPISGTDKIGDVQIATVSKQIQQYTKKLLESYDLSLVESVVIKGKSQYRLFFHDATSETNTGVGIIGGLRLPDTTAWEFSRLGGFRLTAVTSGYLNGVETIFHGDYDGNFFVQETGNTFNGENITSIYSTPFLTFGDAKIKKELRTISTYYRLEGSLEMNVSLKFDWDDEKVLTPAGYIQSTMGVISEYGDGGTYGGGGTYGTSVLNPLLEQSVEGSCHSIMIQYTTSDNNKSHSILGFVLESTTQARR